MAITKRALLTAIESGFFTDVLTRKAETWDVVKPVTNQKALAFVPHLPVYPIDYLHPGVDSDVALYADFTGPPPSQVFVLTRGKSRWLVDTQGYPNLRYIGRLADAA